MQHRIIRQGRTKGDFLLAQSQPGKRQTLGCHIIIKPKMSQSVDVRWAFNVAKWDPGKSAILAATSCVQIEEKERLIKFVFKKDFKASLIGRLMMRKFVADNNSLGLSYDEIKFERDDKGKPVLPDPSLKSLTFNVSHQGAFTVLAGHTRGGLLGVDVAKVEPPRGKTLDAYFRLMDRTFSREEWSAIRNEIDDKSQLFTFYRHWCLKESYLKAVGVGITINLQDVRFETKSKISKNSIVDDTEVFYKNRKLSDWQFQESLLDEEHCVAVASNPKVDRMAFREIGFEELMTNSKPLMPADEAYCQKVLQKLDK